MTAGSAPLTIPVVPPGIAQSGEYIRAGIAGSLRAQKPVNVVKSRAGTRSVTSAFSGADVSS